MKAISRFLHCIGFCIKLFIRLFISWFPKNRKLIIYKSALNLFIDNSKHFFIQNCEMHSEYEHIWLSTNLETIRKVQSIGLKAVNENTLKGIWYTIRAKTVICDNAIIDYKYYKLTVGAIRIQLWHGLPLKMWAYAYEENQPAFSYRSRLRFLYGEDRTHGDYCVSTSHSLDQVFSASFRIPLNQIIHSSYPRVRISLCSEEIRKSFIDKYESKEFSEFYNKLKTTKEKKIIYMPTFRDANKYYINEAIVNWNELDIFCNANNIKLYLKVHRETPMPHGKFTNIVIMDNTMDVYPLLPAFDMLVTDYSSIMYDFALLGKPVCLYTYDLDNYIMHSRNVYKKYRDLHAKLTIADSFNSFLDLLKKDSKNIKRFPVEDYYDNPSDFESVWKFIRDKTL